jgi:hypothetical protein
MKNIILFSNCAGAILKTMFEKHNFTKNKYLIHHITNYTHLNKQNIDNTHINLLKNCDIFIEKLKCLNKSYKLDHISFVNSFFIKI